MSPDLQQLFLWAYALGGALTIIYTLNHAHKKKVRLSKKELFQVVALSLFAWPLLVLAMLESWWERQF